MSPFAARLDRFVRWFFNSSPSAEIEQPSFGGLAPMEVQPTVLRASKPDARAAIDKVFP